MTIGSLPSHVPRLYANVCLKWSKLEVKFLLLLQSLIGSVFVTHCQFKSPGGGAIRQTRGPALS